MKFRLIIDKSKEEEIVVTAHERSALTDKIELLIMQYDGADKIPAFWIFFLNLFKALSILSFSPTLTSGILFSPPSHKI